MSRRSLGSVLKVLQKPEATRVVMVVPVVVEITAHEEYDHHDQDEG